MVCLLEDGVYKPALIIDQPKLCSVVLTRFNLFYPGLREKAGVDTPDKFRQWTQSRVQVFLKFCLPSMLAQTRVPDHWIIGVDEETSDVVSPINKMIEKYPWIKIRWQKKVDGVYERPGVVFSGGLKEIATSEDRDFVTSRVDNDDSVNREFCEVAELYARHALASGSAPDDFWITFPIGAQFDSERVRLYTHPRNHFLSRFETLERVKGGRSSGALDGNHGKVFENKQVYVGITRFPMWMQNVHGENVSNSVGPSFPVLEDTGRELSRFGLKQKDLIKSVAVAS